MDWPLASPSFRPFIFSLIHHFPSLTNTRLYDCIEANVGQHAGTSAIVSSMASPFVASSLGSKQRDTLYSILWFILSLSLIDSRSFLLIEIHRLNSGHTLPFFSTPEATPSSQQIYPQLHFSLCICYSPNITLKSQYNNEETRNYLPKKKKI